MKISKEKFVQIAYAIHYNCMSRSCGTDGCQYGLERCKYPECMYSAMADVLVRAKKDLSLRKVGVVLSDKVQPVERKVISDK